MRRLIPNDCRPAGCGEFSQQDRRVDGGLDIGGALVRNTLILLAADQSEIARVSLPLYRRAVSLSAITAATAYEPRGVFALDGAEGVWFAFTDEYRIRKLSWTADTTIVTELLSPRVPLTDRELAAASATLRSFSEQTGVPHATETGARARPPIAQLAVDDSGRLWVARSSATDGSAEVFDVFDTRGVRIAAVHLSEPISVNPVGVPPDRPSPLVVRGGRLYALDVKSDDDQRILILRVGP